jgi:hypothetical protein
MTKGEVVGVEIAKGIGAFQMLKRTAGSLFGLDCSVDGLLVPLSDFSLSDLSSSGLVVCCSTSVTGLAGCSAKLMVSSVSLMFVWSGSWVISLR